MKKIILFILIGMFLISGCDELKPAPNKLEEKQLETPDNQIEKVTEEVQEEIIEEFKFDIKNCKDYKIELGAGGYTTLSELIKQDHKEIIETEELPTNANRKVTVNEKDVQIGNHGGILSGYILFIDGNEQGTIGNVDIDMKIYQLNEFGEEMDKTLLYSKSFQTTDNDFKLITFNDGEKGETKVLAYLIKDVKIDDFNQKPTECIGEVELKFTNSEGSNFETNPLILFNDLDEPECKKDSYCRICACLSKSTQFQCLADPNIPCAENLQDGKNRCVGGQCETYWDNSDITIRGNIVRKEGEVIGELS